MIEDVDEIEFHILRMTQYSNIIKTPMYSNTQIDSQLALIYSKAISQIKPQLSANRSILAVR